MVFKFQKILFLEFPVAEVSKKRPGDPVQFGFLKTREPQVKFRVGFGPEPALGSSSSYDVNLDFPTLSYAVLSYAILSSAVFWKDPKSFELRSF